MAPRYVTYIPISARNNSAQTSINRDVFPHIEIEILVIAIAAIANIKVAVWGFIKRRLEENKRKHRFN